MAQEQDSKEAVLHDLQEQWERLLGSLEGLTEGDLLAPEVVGIWSIKDLLGHITSWEQETLQMVQEKLAGMEPNFQPYVVDQWNAVQAEKKRSIPLQEVQAAFHETHQHLLELVGQLPEDLFLEMTRVRLAIEAFALGHYVEHREQVEAWRQRGGARQVP